MGEQHGTEHLVFGQFVGLGLHHQHGVFGTGHDHVEAGTLQLLVGGVEDVADFRMETDAGGADRAGERNAGDRQGGGGADHRGDVRIGLLVGGDDGADDLHFIHETFGEQRTDRTVDQARGQGFLLGRTSFTLEETTGDTACGVGLFLVVHGQREEVAAFGRRLGADHGDQHADVVHGDQYGAGGLASDTAGLESDGRLTELELLGYRVHGVFTFYVALGEIGGMPGVGPESIPRKREAAPVSAAAVRRPRLPPARRGYPQEWPELRARFQRPPALRATAPHPLLPASR